MNFLMSDAWADAPAAPVATAGGGLNMILTMGVVFALFYFLAIRPQQKRVKETQSMINALVKGDEVVTSGGILGRITELTDRYATIEIAQGVLIKIQRSSVQNVLPKGTIKSA
jgi:preprotein translocase subunit YajC